MNTASDTNIEAIWPLTPLQHDVLAGSLASADKSLYVTQAVFTLSEAVDAERWKKAWEIVTQRHAALRTSFYWQRQEGAVQIVHRLIEPELLEVVIQESEFEGWLMQQRSRGFLLDRAPLFRHGPVETDGAITRHVWTFHHSILDGASAELIFSEVLSLYGNANDTNTLPEPVSVKPYLAWCARQSTQQETFWRDYLSEWTGATFVPGDKGATGETIQGSEHKFKLPAQTTRALNETARGCGVTLNTVIQSLWACLLSRLTGSSDVVFGTITSGRNANVPNIARAAGLLANTLPLRVTIDNEQSLNTLFRNVQNLQQQLIEFGHVCTAQIKTMADVGAAEVLFNNIVVFENVALPDQDKTRTHVTDRRYIDRTNLALSLLVTPGAELEFNFLYDSSRISSALVESLSKAYTCAVSEAIEDHSRSVAALGFGAHSYTAAQSRASVDYDISINDQIKHCCEQHPERVAITQGDSVLRYAELNLLSDKVSGFLHAVSDKNGPVAVCAEASPQTVALVIGCLRAGRPYVYLDPAYPAARNEQILCELENAYPGDVDIVTDTPASVSGDFRFIDIQTVLTSEAELPYPIPRPTPDALAYIVFTSGSTGKPKGVRVTHSNLAYSNNVRKQFYAQTPQRFLLLSSLSFDSSVAGLFWTLAFGGVLVLAPGGVKQHLDSLSTLVFRYKISHTLCLPSVYALMLQRSDSGDLDTLDTVIVAGESCPEALFDLHNDNAPNARLFNEYGPSEATVWCSCAEITGREKAVPVGKAIPGSEIFVLNSTGQILPDGFEGELAVYGPGVAAGYLNDAGLTGQKFAKPSDVSPYQTYRTGDLGWRQDGTYYLRGRTDNQVKINGVRVELEEIEFQLRQFAEVENAIVVVRAIEADQALVAYLKLKSSIESTPDVKEIGVRLKDKLPPAMLPSKMFLLDEFPLNDNGKVDRPALADLAQREIKPKDDSEFSEPLGDVNASARVRHLMEKIIGDDLESDDASFFDNGGNSLSVVRLVDLVTAEFNQEINVADVYEHPTAKQLATHVNTKSGKHDWLSVTPIQTKGNHPPLFFAYGNAQKLSNTLGSDYPVYWVVHGTHGVVVPTAPIAELAKQHYQQIKSIQPGGPYFLCGFSLGAYVMLEVARLMRTQNEDVAMLALLDPTSPQTYLHKSRWNKLHSFMTGSYSARVKVRYLLMFARRALRTMLNQCFGATQQEQRTNPTSDNKFADNITLSTNSRLSQTEILQMVNTAMQDYDFKKCPGGAELVRVLDHSAFNLNWWDEEMAWRDLFEGEISTFHIEAAGKHNDFFRDEASLQNFADWIKTRLAEK